MPFSRASFFQVFLKDFVHGSYRFYRYGLIPRWGPYRGGLGTGSAERIRMEGYIMVFGGMRLSASWPQHGNSPRRSSLRAFRTL